jgi:hypothetical protein
MIKKSNFRLENKVLFIKCVVIGREIKRTIYQQSSLDKIIKILKIKRKPPLPSFSVPPVPLGWGLPSSIPHHGLHHQLHVNLMTTPV